MAKELHKAVLVLFIASVFALGEFDRNRDLLNDRSRRAIARQVGNLLAKGAKYPASLRRFLQVKIVLLKDATIYGKNPMVVKYRKYGGIRRAESDFDKLGPYSSFHGEFAAMNGHILRSGDIGGYTVLLKYLKTDGAPKYCIQMSKTAQFEGIQRAPVIQVDYV